MYWRLIYLCSLPLRNLKTACILKTYARMIFLICEIVCYRNAPTKLIATLACFVIPIYLGIRPYRTKPPLSWLNRQIALKFWPIETTTNAQAPLAPPSSTHSFTLPKQFVYLDKGNRQDEPRKDNKYNLAPSTRKISLWHANQEVTGHSRRSWCM